MATAEPTRSVELFVRSLSPADGPIDSPVRRVRDLEAGGRVDSASVLVWGREVGLSRAAERTAAGQFFLDRVATFRAWAGEHDVSLEPFFETRAVTASITGEEYVALALPVCCLAEYVDDELRHVAPCCTDETVCTVADRLGSLAAVDTPPGRPDATLRVARQ